ncbi:MAG: Tol-Pal system protein TolB [Alphaproteobacteria bacterium]|nr:Tol-Pal system protein TolB [Alphaproteobacteria bacterium]
MRLFLSFVAALVLFVPALAHAELKIAVTQGRVEPMPVAISAFVGDGANAQIGQQMTDIISHNLEGSGLFRPLNPASFVQDARSAALDGPRFADWKPLNSQALVTGAVTAAPDGRLRVEFRLWDVFGEVQVDGMAYTTTPQNWRRIAHIISDSIFKRLTGEEGYFDTRIVYIAESGPFNARVKRLAIMDQDGANHRYLTDGSYMVLTPRFSPSSQEITYLAYVNGKPRVYLYNIDTGRQEVLGDFPGMTFAPRFSPDGNSVVMSLAAKGNTDLYLMDLRTRQIRQLTNNPSIETAASFSPDGRRVVFESDRSGKQQLYTMNVDGSNQQRITFGDGRYGNPVWSPRGDLIAFTKMLSGKFFIGVVKPDGSGERLIVSAFHVEGPSWAPNGRYLTYFKEQSTGKGRTAHAYKIDLTGFNERQIDTPGDASDPAWSPLNP